MLKKILFFSCLLLSIHTDTWAIIKESEKPIALLLMGPPGSGQGVLSVKIAKTFSIPHISPVNLLVKELHEETFLAEKVREYLNAKSSIPENLIMEMLYEHIKQDDCSSGFLLDGIPNTLAEAQDLGKNLSSHFQILAISISISDEALLLREGGRLVCQYCGHVYHKLLSPPDAPMTCDHCSKELVQLDEDTPENVIAKLQEWRSRMLPVLEYFRKEGCLQEVNGDCPFDITFEEIKRLYRKKVRATEDAWN